MKQCAAANLGPGELILQGRDVLLVLAVRDLSSREDSDYHHSDGYYRIVVIRARDTKVIEDDFWYANEFSIID